MLSALRDNPDAGEVPVVVGEQVEHPRPLGPAEVVNPPKANAVYSVLPTRGLPAYWGVLSHGLSELTGIDRAAPYATLHLSEDMRLPQRTLHPPVCRPG